MQSYATKKTTPSRMARKQARRGVFMVNKKAKRTQRKAERLSRKAHREEQGD
jgi:hypothetical protein